MGGVVAESFDYCPHCGQQPWVDEELSQEEKKLPWNRNRKAPRVTWDKCCNCGEVVDSSYDYCPHCGIHEFHEYSKETD